MFSLFALVPLFAVIAKSVAHEGHHPDQIPLDYVKYPYQATYYPHDDGTSPSLSFQLILSSPSPNIVTAYSVFSGITTFAKLPWVECLGKGKDEAFDIAIIGAPFVSTLASPSTLFSYTLLRIRGRRTALARASVHRVSAPAPAASISTADTMSRWP